MMKPVPHLRKILVPGCVLLLCMPFLLNLAACASPAYYSQAISGHLELMRKRENIREILDSGEASPELTHELELALEIRAFASARLALPDNDSYSQFVETGRDAVTWNVLAVPEFSLEPRQWCFLVSGCVAYRGYFKIDSAQKFAGKLSADGYDTSVSPAVAYSTLGWFDDPLLDTMLRYSDEQLAGFIFHELAHQQLYLKGDTVFSESYASFVEETGVRLWLTSTGRSDLVPGWLHQQQAALQFNSLLRGTRNELQALYAKDLPAGQMRERKAIIFNRLRDAYSSLVESQWGGKPYYQRLFASEPNNATLALVNSYQGGVCAFEKLYHSAAGDMSRFHQLAMEKAALNREQRTAWLNQPCDVIASNPDL